MSSKECNSSRQFTYQSYFANGKKKVNYGRKYIWSKNSPNGIIFCSPRINHKVKYLKPQVNPRLKKKKSTRKQTTHKTKKSRRKQTTRKTKKKKKTTYLTDKTVFKNGNRGVNYGRKYILTASGRKKYFPKK
jgi:hypothetical protein